MDMINLYTREVGRQLPERMQADIEKEIRSLIEDMLEDEAARAGREPDEAMVVEVLKRMGPPEKVAASYLPPRYLIGPELYPHFINTLRIVLSIVTVLAALGIGVSVGARAGETQSVFEVIGQVISGISGAMFQAAAIVVLIFAVLQFAAPNLKSDPAEWDPRKLPANPDLEKVNLPGTLFELIFTVLALIVFNFYSQWIGISSVINGEWVHLPVLSAAFFRYLPWLSLVWLLQIVLNVWLAARGTWTNGLRWASAAVSALSVGVLAWMMTGPALVQLPVELLTRFSAELPTEAVSRINEGLLTSVRLVLGLVIALEIVEIGKNIFKLLRPRLPEPIMVK